MVEFFRRQTKQLNRSRKPNPLKNIISRTNKKEEVPLLPLNSGLTSPTIVSPIITNSASRHNDPYTPHISPTATKAVKQMNHMNTTNHTPSYNNNKGRPSNVNHSDTMNPFESRTHHKSSLEDNYQHSYFDNPDQYRTGPLTPTTVKTEIYSTQSIMTTTPPNHVTLYSQQCYTSTTFLSSQSPLSPSLSLPPLSPTNVSLATSSNKPSWREMKHAATYQPAASISSTDNDEDDSLGALATPSSIENPLIDLLGDNSSEEEDDDDDLIPIGQLSLCRNNDIHHLSAAEKYKAKVRAKLDMGFTPDDNHKVKLLI
ncbi:uncharacterized protein BX663DRAFT_491349 [Cokeromyces recurvatus]|uniref:uncharacterized protein n=1 Tax=Cokeromyces recurvatus TaxID=90255 RepID=UPI002220FF0F|nr:uncharacterized protein BX663DRAFT_491349 [Cokeromyces recurvatus]KAI7907572.1 hypothetical protein BX663DRAFT_491349 [Cokeromyces recurvatus]